MFYKLMLKTKDVFSNPHVQEAIKSFTTGVVAGYIGHKTGEKFAKEEKSNGAVLNYGSSNAPKLK